jgi:hypothetical protein
MLEDYRADRSAPRPAVSWSAIVSDPVLRFAGRGHHQIVEGLAEGHIREVEAAELERPDALAHALDRVPVAAPVNPIRSSTPLFKAVRKAKIGRIYGVSANRVEHPPRQNFELSDISVEKYSTA